MSTLLKNKAALAKAEAEWIRAKDDLRQAHARRSAVAIALIFAKVGAEGQLHGKLRIVTNHDNARGMRIGSGA